MSHVGRMVARSDLALVRLWDPIRDEITPELATSSGDLVSIAILRESVLLGSFLDPEWYLVVPRTRPDVEKYAPHTIRSGVSGRPAGKKQSFGLLSGLVIISSKVGSRK